LGGGRVVYLKWDEDEKRLPYFAQVGVGALALPGLIQWIRSQRGAGDLPLLGKVEAPPTKDELNDLHRDIGRWWELGTVYTMLAGLLNVLVIYDALCGPAYVAERAAPA